MGTHSPNVWWPGEALNPLQLPPGRSLPPGATSGRAAVRALVPGSLDCQSKSCLLAAQLCSAQLASVQALQ